MAMMMQSTAGASTSKVLILLGAGLTGSIVLRSGQLSELISQLQELLKGVNEVQISPGKYDTAVLAAQIQQLAREIKELTVSRPVTIVNGSSASSGGIASYLLPAATLGAMGYCYMWWKGWSFSDVMFVTKHNMANAVTAVSKQLENLSETLASTKRHLAKRLENLEWKAEEQNEISKLISRNVDDLKSGLSQIGVDVETIQQMICGLEGKIELLESKQDMTNSGLLYLCQVAGGIEEGLNTKPFQNGAKVADRPAFGYKGTPLEGLKFITETDESGNVEDSGQSLKGNDPVGLAGKMAPATKTRIHRSYPVGISLTRDIMGSEL